MHIRSACLLSLALVIGSLTEVWAHPPAVEPPVVFAGGIAGPEGIAFTRRNGFVVGTRTGEIIRFDAAGNQTLLASVGDELGGMVVLRDGRILAAAGAAGRVWSVAPDGSTSVFANVAGHPNFIVETRRKRRIFASVSFAGTIVDITDGTPVVVASGLSFPNGLAIGKFGRERFLYVAESVAQRVLRLPLDRNDVVGPGPAEVVAEGLPIADGLAFDRARNLLVVGGGTFKVIRADTGAVETLSADPLLNFPTNLAFGRGRGFRHRDLYVVNFGLPLGSGMKILRFRYNHSGARVSR